MSYKNVLFGAGLLLSLCGCQFAGTLLTGTQKLGGILLDDRSLSDDAADVRINLEIRDSLARLDGRYAVDIELTVFEGEVLLNGALPDLNRIQNVIETVWAVEGVSKVYNYIRVDNPPTLDVVNHDAAVSAKIRTELMITPDVNASNYKITMENGVIYLMGIVSSPEEYARVLGVIKNTDGVSKIIFLMRNAV